MEGHSAVNAIVTSATDARPQVLDCYGDKARNQLDVTPARPIETRDRDAERTRSRGGFEPHPRRWVAEQRIALGVVALDPRLSQCPGRNDQPVPDLLEEVGD